MSKELLSGNEAVARGAWEAGVTFGVGYPGTPSTEVLETFGKLPGTHAEWAPNEKVALEVGIGISAAGGRALVTMKHVGVNVAADPLFTAAYTGVGGGLVVFAADDPGMHSSQNEQDSHYYAQAAHIPMLDPADSDEARRFVATAFSLSERFDIPIMVRSTVRVSHAKSLVETSTRTAADIKPYEKNPQKWVMMPAMARRRRLDLDRRIQEFTRFVSENTADDPAALNRVELKDRAFGVICSGAVYQYVREALPEASILKLGVTYPLDREALYSFASSVEKVYVIEEASTYLLDAVRSLGLSVEDANLRPDGELSPELIACAFGDATACAFVAADHLPERPPVLCPGCPHRVVFNELRRIRAIVTGDIGCYTLGALPPLAGIDTCVDMGASISMAHGFELVRGTSVPDPDNLDSRPIVAVIGDSTFAHSGISSLLGTVYNAGGGTVAILDNRTTAMTGHQGNPVSGITLQGRLGRELELEPFLKGIGVSRVRTVDAQNIKDVRGALKEETHEQELSVIIFRAPCALLDKTKRESYSVLSGTCRACGSCLQLGCPAIERTSDGKAQIIRSLCVGCGQCAQICAYGAIVAPASTYQDSEGAQ